VNLDENVDRRVWGDASLRETGILQQVCELSLQCTAVKTLASRRLGWIRLYCRELSQTILIVRNACAEADKAASVV
jgi:hypothetical protein